MRHMLIGKGMGHKRSIKKIDPIYQRLKAENRSMKMVEIITLIFGKDPTDMQKNIVRGNVRTLFKKGKLEKDPITKTYKAK